MEELKILYDNSGLEFRGGERMLEAVDRASAKQCESLTTNLRDDDSCIVFLCEGNERVVGVRALLCVGCKVIENMLMNEGDMKESRAKEVSLPEISSIAMRIKIDFACYGKFDLHYRYNLIIPMLRRNGPWVYRQSKLRSFYS
ncbi:hypothetical protein R1flu_028883 [Riccia fluitans]|uniref:Uncharacterized protein n=1 Tax=Riccia fluitans TaxID=41844 RepID=A0ABD1XMY5_9MARC